MLLKCVKRSRKLTKPGSVPVLLPEDEAKFTIVTYNYYDRLNGYEYLKTIIHIPGVNSAESSQ